MSGTSLGTPVPTTRAASALRVPSTSCPRTAAEATPRAGGKNELVSGVDAAWLSRNCFGMVPSGTLLLDPGKDAESTCPTCLDKAARLGWSNKIVAESSVENSPPTYCTSSDEANESKPVSIKGLSRGKLVPTTPTTSDAIVLSTAPRDGGPRRDVCGSTIRLGVYRGTARSSRFVLFLNDAPRARGGTADRT